MIKIQNLSGITPDLPFTEYDFYGLYGRAFEKSELGMIKLLGSRPEKLLDEMHVAAEGIISLRTSPWSAKP